MPAAADGTQVTADDLKGGPRSIGVPGLVAAVLGVHERHGTLPRAVVMAPAIRLAEEGFPLTWKNVDFFRRARPQLTHSPEAERTFLVGGDVPRPGAEPTTGPTSHESTRRTSPWPTATAPW